MKMIDLKIETLEKSSLSELVEVYNTLATELGEPQVKRFADKPSGLKRIAKLIEMKDKKGENPVIVDQEWVEDTGEEIDPLLNDQECTDEEMSTYLETQQNMTTTTEPAIEAKIESNISKQYYFKLQMNDQEILVEGNTIEELQAKYTQNLKWQLIGKNFVPVFKAGETEPFSCVFTAKTTRIEYKGWDTLCYIRPKTKTRRLFDAINKPEGASWAELNAIVNLGTERVREYLRYDLNRLHGVGLEQLPNNRIRAKCPANLKHNYNREDKLDYFDNNFWSIYEKECNI